MNKKIINKENLFPKITSGISEIANIVKRTLGPGGLPIIIERIGQSLDGSPLPPKITKDGVSVANECADIDPEKNLIIQSVKAICKKTNTMAGDGTTTAIVLGEAILIETMKELAKDKKLNPQLVKEEIEKSSKKVIEELNRLSKKVKDLSVVEQIATISSNGDSEIGSIIKLAFDSVGAEGVITVDEGNTNKTTLDVVEGYQFRRGAEGRDRFFNNKELTCFEVQNCRLIIYDGKLFNYTELLPALTTIGEANEDDFRANQMPPVVIIANEFSNEVIQFLLMQRAEVGMSFCCVKGPDTSYVRSGYYDDLAAMSGGYRFGNGNKALSAFDLGDEGQVSRIIVDKYTTTLYDGQGTEETVLERVDQLKAMKALAESPYDAQVLSDRIAALTSGIAKIGVGGNTEFEIKEKYDRIEDALNASRAAIEEGFIPGGGIVFYRIAVNLEKSKNLGDKIMSKALKYPLFQILENIGIKPNKFNFYKELLKNLDLTYDARNKKIVNALDAGIIDPTKVARCALENAVSIAALLSTAGGGIIYIK